jgi:hypothetical protein
MGELSAGKADDGRDGILSDKVLASQVFFEESVDFSAFTQMHANKRFSDKPFKVRVLGARKDVAIGLPN